jgi:hypothetical protein
MNTNVELYFVYAYLIFDLQNINLIAKCDFVDFNKNLYEKSIAFCYL